MQNLQIQVYSSVMKRHSKSNSGEDRMPTQKYHGTENDHRELKGRKYENIFIFEQSGPPEKKIKFNEY